MEGTGRIPISKNEKPSIGAAFRPGKTRKTQKKAEMAGSKRKHRSKLESLRCWPGVQLKVKAGISCESIAEWIQDIQLEYREVQRDAVVRSLYRYKSSLPPAELDSTVPMFVQKAIEKISRGVKEIDELEKLYLLQLTRISIDAQTETKINKLFGGTSNEIRLAMDLLDRRARLMMEMGLVKRAPVGLSVSADIGMGLNLAIDPVDGLPDEKAMRLGIAAEKLLSVMLKASDAELNEAVTKEKAPVN